MNDLSEKEQLDELRTWWAENRGMIIGVAVLAIAVIVGIRQWDNFQAGAALEASSRYEELINAVADNEIEPATDIATDLFDNYSGTVYADQARLAMARLYMDRGRDADAADVLKPLARGGDEPINLVARLRLARILLYQDKPQDVLDMLGRDEDSAFAARFNEARGDAHVALGNFGEAAAAYQAVLADPQGQQTVDVNFVQMKLMDLPDPDEAAAAVAADAMPAGDQASAGEASEAADETAQESADDAGVHDEAQQ